jgi:hypothetical protein
LGKAQESLYCVGRQSLSCSGFSHRLRLAVLPPLPRQQSCLGRDGKAALQSQGAQARLVVFQHSLAGLPELPRSLPELAALVLRGLGQLAEFRPVQPG